MDLLKTLDRKILLKEQVKSLLLADISIIDLQIEDLEAQSSRLRMVPESAQEKKGLSATEVELGR